MNGLNHRNECTMLELVRTFADASHSPIWFWRGEWFVWNGTHYNQVGREGVEQRVMSFLETNSTVPSGSAIRRFMDLLRVVRYSNSPVAPCWLTTGGSPAPAELFVVNNGLLRLTETPVLLPHDPAFFGLSAADYDFCPTAKCPRWQRFLRDLWPDKHDSIELLQQWFGYCLLPDTSQQKMLAIIGLPRSGKSTITRVLRELLGHNNVACPSIRSLSGQFGLWGLLDKLVAIVPDAMLLRPCPALEELLKSISGEDAVDIHRKGLPPLTGVKLPTRIVIVANDPPRFCDPSKAIDRRIMTLRTSRSFFGTEDITLTGTLLQELPGILNWAIRGLERLHSVGHFELPKTVNIDAKALLQAVPDPDRVSRIVIQYGRHDRRRHGESRHRPWQKEYSHD